MAHDFDIDAFLQKPLFAHRRRRHLTVHESRPFGSCGRRQSYGLSETSVTAFLNEFRLNRAAPSASSSSTYRVVTSVMSVFAAQAQLRQSIVAACTVS